MYTRATFYLILSLLPIASCVVGAEEAVTFPTYKIGEASFPSPVSVAPLFSGGGNYGLIASGDTLYHMELQHGRIHGTTDLGGEITSLAIGSDTEIFLTLANSLVRVDGFSISKSITLQGTAERMTVCGSNPVVLLDDGSISIYEATDLSIIASFTAESGEITCIEGFPELLVLGYSDGKMISIAVPSFSRKALETVNGNLLFMNRAGNDYFIFSTDAWNEVAVSSPEDLLIQSMYTFPETPVSAAADSTLSCIYAVCPSMGIRVCLSNGEIAWKSTEYGSNPIVVLARDCETAMIAWENKVSLLVK